MLTQQGFQRILVAADFSPSFDAAFKQARWLANASGAKLVLAHVVPDVGRALESSSLESRLDLREGDGELIQRGISLDAETRLRRAIGEVAVTDTEIESRTLVGEAYFEITHLVQQEGFDLVIAGTRGLSSFERFFVGSTAKRLIRKCAASVWVVNVDQNGPPSVVLGATDFSDVSRKAVLHGYWVAQQAQADFHLLHVVDSEDVPVDVISRIPAGSSLRQEINAAAEERLEKFLGSLNLDRSRVQLHLTYGTPWREIQRLVERLDVDLIAIGTVGRSGITGLLIGNTAEKLLDTCDCSILTVKPDTFQSPIISNA